MLRRLDLPPEPGPAASTADAAPGGTDPADTSDPSNPSEESAAPPAPAAPDPVDYTVELKIDGVAVSLRYESGRFVRGATRGDRATGEDVTANLATLAELPRALPAGSPASAAGAVLEVRGKVYMTIADFDALNSRRAAGAEAA